jgi:hypothetical protein
VVGLPGVHVEVKRVEALNIRKAVEQSVHDADSGEAAIVLHRQNRTPWLVTVRLADLPALTRAVAGMLENAGAGEKREDTQNPHAVPPPLRPGVPTNAGTRPEGSDARAGRSGADLARCRDCWHWKPSGIRHGCAAGVPERPSPDWRGECPRFTAVCAMHA